MSETGVARLPSRKNSRGDLFQIAAPDALVKRS